MLATCDAPTDSSNTYAVSIWADVAFSFFTLLLMLSFSVNILRDLLNLSRSSLHWHLEQPGHASIEQRAQSAVPMLGKKASHDT